MNQETPFSETLSRFHADPRSLLGIIPGIWITDKPSGPSSNVAVGRARRALKIRRVGHAGTLDPLASGLLVLLAGNATRLFDHMQTFTKDYRARFRLGERTDSADITGKPAHDWSPTRQVPVTREELEAALTGFIGDIEQVPPMHSALKRDGVPLYRLARQGETVDRAPRPMRVESLRLGEFDGSEGVLDMRVSKGFYVRSLVDDMGMALGCGAVMTALTRTAIGPFSLEDAAGDAGLALFEGGWRP